VAHLDLGNAVPNRAAHARKPATDPECDEDSIGIMFHWGYKPESHQVVTEDGYILTMHRLPYGKSGPSSTGGAPRPVIFLQHGLEGDSSNWITNLPWEAAGFLFADAGFDVWMGNFRGNTYSKEHVSLDPSKDPFWAFSFDEMAAYDLPIMIDTVLNHTGQSQVYYIGHSMGTMTMFAKLSLDQVFASKIRKYFALAPVATVTHMGGMLSYLAPYTNDLEFLLKLIGGYGEFLPSNELMHLVAKYMCGSWITNPLCSDLIFLIFGTDSNQLNTTRVPVYVAHTPAGTSTQNVVHFGQVQNAGKFLMYDYGSPQQNFQHYKQDKPPVYDLTKVTVPVYIYRSDADFMADPQDVDYLETQLPNIKQSIHLDGFNHMDFVWGLNAAGQIYLPMIDLIKADP